MKIRINPKELTESPYTCTEENKETRKGHESGDEANQEEPNEILFRFDDGTLESLSDELINASPTSLMISGFRGAGKTSFIERIQEHLRDKQTRDDRETVFVKLNFSKYEEHRFVIRKLIRNLYLAIKEKPKFRDLKNQKNTNSDLNGAQKLESLYKKTYLDVQTQLNIKSENSKETKTEVSLTQKLGPIAEGVLGIGASTAFLTNLENTFGRFAIGGLLLVFSALKAIQIKNTFTKRSAESESTEQVEKTIYDDEIADFLFRDLLQSLEKHFRLVFVLDELDKIQDGDKIDKVINELKPFLLSGYCNFILVSGQDLYYRFFNASFESDPVLSSIFSRTHHIGLSQNMTTMVDHFITQVSKGKGDGDFYYDLQRSLVFDSHRIPRKLVANIRELISRSKWLEEDGVFELELTTKDQEVFTRNKIIEEVIERVMIPAFSQKGVINNNPPLRDLFISQMYIWANRLFYLEEEEEYETSIFLDDVEPWNTRLPNLKARRQAYLEVFLNALARTGFVSFDESAQTFIINWEPTQNQGSAIKQEPVVKAKEGKPKASKPRKAAVKKQRQTEEEVSQEVNLTQEKGAVLQEESIPEAPVKPPRKKKDQDEFQEAYEGFVSLATAIYQSLGRVIRKNLSESDDAAAPSEIGDTLNDDYVFTFTDLGLHPPLADALHAKHERFIEKFQNEDDMSKLGSAADVVEMQLMKHTILVGYLTNLPHLLGQMDFEIHSSESVSIQEQRIPNVDVLIQSHHQNYVTTAFKVIVFDEFRDLPQETVIECVDFLRRINKITGKQHKLMILIFSETRLDPGEFTEIGFQDLLREALVKNTEHIPYMEIKVFDLATVGHLAVDYHEFAQDRLITFSGSDVRLNVQGEPDHQIIRGDYGAYLSTQAKGSIILESDIAELNELYPYRGNLWLHVCYRKIEEVDVLLYMDLFNQKDVGDEVKGFLLKAKPDGRSDELQMINNAVGEEIEVYGLNPTSREMHGDWNLDLYNIYDAFEKSYWQPYMLRRLYGIEINGKSPKSIAEFAYFKLHFDVEDTTFEGLGLLAG